VSRSWTVEDMYELGTRHANLEAKLDLEATLATLVESPVYEFHPLRRRMLGMQQVRRYYEHLFGSFIPRTRSYQLVQEWVNTGSVAQEYDIDVEVDGVVERHRVLGVLVAEGRLLGGERVYASERCARLMVGDLLDELESF
jgi:hypothetical protein